MESEEVKMMRRAFDVYGDTLHKVIEHDRQLEEEAEREEKVKQFIRDMHKNRRSND